MLRKSLTYKSGTGYAMKQLEIVIRNPTGLHARPAKVLVKLAKRFQSDIKIQHGEKTANAKSMVSVLTLGASKGANVTVMVDGEDEETALAEIEAAIRSGLGDEDIPVETKAPETVSVPRSKVEALAKSSPPGVLQGVAAAPGIAIGPVFQYQKTEIDLSKANAKESDLQAAIRKAREQLRELYQQMLEIDEKLEAEAVIFEAHIEILEDPDLLDAVKERLKAGREAALAWKEAIEERAAALAALKDPTLSARADDLRDVGTRVLRLMLGIKDEEVRLPNTPVVVIARELSPSETAAFDTKRVLGFGIVEGGPTSHIAILARALGLPAVVSAEESILSLKNRSQLILNGNDGTLIPDPSSDAVASANKDREQWLEARRIAREQSNEPAVTLDGHRVDVTANAGSTANAVEAMKMGADGIGLLRTEFLFLERTTAPSEEEQFAEYRSIAETMDGRPVIVRTLDIGGDKPLPYIQLKPELNPFLGERGIRLCLNRPELFREQLRAILRASKHGKLRIMFPMVSDINELRRARVLVEEIQKELGVEPVQLGIMIEVPSTALMADAFAPEVDFFSIGTNDLTQYTIAIDRGHPALASMHDGLHPAVLRLIAKTIEAAHQNGKRADICGELGSDPLAIPILLGLGMDELSVSIPSVPTVKAQVRTLNLEDIKPLAQKALACSTAQEVRELVKNFTS
jgi:phosphoenolpyruvate-protein phosphotransferase